MYELIRTHPDGPDRAGPSGLPSDREVGCVYIDPPGPGSPWGTQARGRLFDVVPHAHHSIAAAPAIVGLLVTLALAVALGWMFFQDSATNA